MRATSAAWLGAVCLILGACGEHAGNVFVVEGAVGQEPNVDGSFPDATYYLSATGSDRNPGTAELPWQTFAFAIPKLHAGSTLVLTDGVYDETSSGYPSIVCPLNAESGSASRPIVIRAEHERQAFIRGNGSAHPFYIDGCSNWTIEGLHVENGDFGRENGPQPGTVFWAQHVKQLVVRRLLGARPNRSAARSSILLISDDSSDVLVEESEFYAFHWAALRVAKNSSVVLRRNYAHSRDYADLAPVATLEPGRGDAGFWLRLVDQGVVENNIAENVAHGFALTTESDDGGAGYTSDHNLLIGNIALNTTLGFRIDSRCSLLGAACSATAKPVSSPSYVDNVAVDSQEGFSSQGAFAVQVQGFSAIDSSQYGLRADHDADHSPAFEASIVVQNALSVRPGVSGFIFQNQTSFALDHASVAGAPTMGAYTPEGEFVTNALLTDPELGACLVYLPSTSPLRHAGAGGLSIGANVLWRSRGGIPTEEPLWSGPDHAFPCGAVVAGLNDTPDNSCIGVHQRLHVGSPDCPLPP